MESHSIVTFLMIYLPIVFLIVLITGSVLLQIYLSRKQAIWPGLILPTIFFLAFLANTIFRNYYSESWGLQLGINICITVLAGNIPTMIMLTIYFICRDKLKTK